MKSTEKSKLTSFDFDLRIRARHLAAGTLDPKTIEKYLADLPDLDANAETLPYEQPALGDGDDDL